LSEVSLEIIDGILSNLDPGLNIVWDEFNPATRTLKFSLKLLQGFLEAVSTPWTSAVNGGAEV